MSSSVSNMLFDIQEQSVSYGDFIALKNISLSIGVGEKVAIIGPSGAGKSTLLKHLYEILPDQCSLIHQDFGLIKQLSVFHNVYMGRLNHFGTLKNIRNFFLPQKDNVNEISNVLREFDIDNKIHLKTEALSGGQQQRVSVCRALYHNATIVLGDEPISALDTKNAHLVIERLIHQYKTVVLSLHNVELALKYADRIIGLKKGRLFFDKEVEKVTQEEITELYHQ